MMIDTTVYIQKELLHKLRNTADILQKPRNMIISLLIQKAMRKGNHTIQISSQIKYQKRRLKASWCRLHLLLTEVEYEYCLDMRKLYKMSVSLILACAINIFLEEIIEDGLTTHNGNIKNGDNYPNNYVFISRTSQGVFFYIIFWDFPDKTLLSHVLL